MKTSRQRRRIPKQHKGFYPEHVKFLVCVLWCQGQPTKRISEIVLKKTEFRIPHENIRNVVKRDDWYRRRFLTKNTRQAYLGRLKTLGDSYGVTEEWMFCAFDKVYRNQRWHNS